MSVFRVPAKARQRSGRVIGIEKDASLVLASLPVDCRVATNQPEAGGLGIWTDTLSPPSDQATRVPVKVPSSFALNVPDLTRAALLMPPSVWPGGAFAFIGRNPNATRPQNRIDMRIFSD